MDYVQLFVSSVLYIAPAYVANASACLFKGKTRLDMGYDFFDGRPLLGRGKTIKGFLSGFLAGSAYSVLWWSIIGYIINLETGFLLSLGAMVGDSIGSFIKRRLNLKSGDLAPFLDQWDFVFGAFLFVYLGKLAGLYVFLPSFTQAILILVITVFVHLILNVFSYMIGLKEVPW